MDVHITAADSLAGNAAAAACAPGATPRHIRPAPEGGYIVKKTASKPYSLISPALRRSHEDEDNTQLDRFRMRLSMANAKREAVSLGPFPDLDAAVSARDMFVKLTSNAPAAPRLSTKRAAQPAAGGLSAAPNCRAVDGAASSLPSVRAHAHEVRAVKATARTAAMAAARGAADVRDAEARVLRLRFEFVLADVAAVEAAAAVVAVDTEHAAVLARGEAVLLAQATAAAEDLSDATPASPPASGATQDDVAALLATEERAAHDAIYADENFEWDVEHAEDVLHATPASPPPSTQEEVHTRAAAWDFERAPTDDENDCAPRQWLQL